MNKWKQLCQANMDHYNNDPALHNAECVAYGAVVVVLFLVARRKLSIDWSKTQPMK